MLKRLLRDERGANLIEFAFALPVLVAFIWGIFQIGMIYQANAGMQHALGEAARAATIFPTPTDTDIQNVAAAKKFGTFNGSLAALNIVTMKTGDLDGDASTPPGSGSPVYKDLTLTYTHTMRFLYLPARSVTLTQTKRVYLAS